MCIAREEELTGRSKEEIRENMAVSLDIMKKATQRAVTEDIKSVGGLIGGEAKKLAIARALYKDTPFIILDEPTAALDPISEYEIFEKINKISKSKTTIYISHRLSSCCFCDTIFVFHKGKLIQEGAHNTLLSERKGKYYELWNTQAQFYQE